MAATEITVQMQQRRDPAANWTSANPTLLSGELGFETDTKRAKLGNGSTAWNSLSYIPGFQISAYPIPTTDIADDAITAAKLADTTVTAGSYGAANITVDAQGRITSAANGAIGTSQIVDDAVTGDKLANDITIANDLTVTNNLTVNGTTTTINSTTLQVDDKNIELGTVDTPSDTTANGGGITLKGTTDHTIIWTDSTDSWDFSEHVNLASGKEFRIAGTKVLDATSLGSAVVSSSLTSVGTIATGVWNGSVIAADYIADVRNVPQNSQTAAYTLVAGDAGKHISITTGGVTVPSGVFSVGDAVTIYNDSGSAQTITQGSSVTLRIAGASTAGNKTLAGYGLCTVLCVASNVFVAGGAGLS